MPSAVPSKSAPLQHDAIDNYDVGDLSDDPFASPSPESASKKRKEPDSGLGIDEEVSVQKRARVPNVKLDENRLLSENGIPKLRSRARGLKLKGKGHEFSDAARLLSFYQLWLDDLFPKAKFRDALSMVEKAGHKKRMVIARNQWIKEGEPKSGNGDDELEETGDLPETATGHAQAAALPARPATPPRNQDVPDDDDIYGVTPIAQRRPRTVANFDEPDEDDLEALMAEAEGQDAPPPPQVVGPDDDELEALMAEAENETASNTATSANNAPKPPVNEYADEEAAMAEMEGLW